MRRWLREVVGIVLGNDRRRWERAYDEAMQWRDWETCDQLLAERQCAYWWKG